MIENDYSSTFSEIRSQLVDSKGDNYLTLRKRLTPRYFRTWTIICLHWILLVGVLVLLCQIRTKSLWAPLGGAVLLSILVHRLHLFLHEGSHNHLARTKELNDLLTNLFLGPLVMSDVESYRRHHVLHHRYLGLPSDPERSYQSILNWRFVICNISGFSSLKKGIEQLRTRQSESDRGNARWVLISGFLLHVVVISMGVWISRPVISIAWIIAIGSLFPLIAATRQLLEHKPLVSEFERTSFPLTRMFKKGPMTFLLGSAGFDRHLLHHWDPGVPYCRLAELERALYDMGCREILEARRSNYLRTCATVWGKS